MGYNPQESVENTIDTMGTLLVVHPIVPWQVYSKMLPIQNKNIGGPRQISSMLLKIARNTKKSIGGPRQILLNFAQNCSQY